VQLQSYASDLLEDAMILAQTKALNSFSFRDTINSLTELWGYCYERIAQIDAGYYSQTMRLTQKLTHLPPFVKNTIRVYSAREQIGFSRRLYMEAGMNDLNAPRTFHVSGNDIYCWDADLRTVWLEYIPEPPFITFTKNNRDPKILKADDDKAKKPYYEQRNYGMYRLWGREAVEKVGSSSSISEDIVARLNDDQYDIEFVHRMDNEAEPIVRNDLRRDGYEIVAFILDQPWLFITYQRIDDSDIVHYESFLTQWVLSNGPMLPYNPFDFQGRGSNVKFIQAEYNDYTGMGVTIEDQADGNFKVLGFTPDTLMTYPSRIMYNYMVASMAQRFAALNGATIMAVEIALVQAQDEMGLWMKKNKSAWMRANNVTGPQLSDFL